MIKLARLKSPVAATSATSATSLLEAAETLAIPGSRPAATSCYPVPNFGSVDGLRAPGSRRVAGTLLPGIPSKHAGFAARVAEVAEVAGHGALTPAAPCPACGSGAFYQAPGDGWRCSLCEPPMLPTDPAGWLFCGVPGGKPLPPLPMPPAPLPLYLDEILPDPLTAPVGKCRYCRFLAPLGQDGVCGACIYARLLTERGLCGSSSPTEGPSPDGDTPEGSVLSAERALTGVVAISDEGELLREDEP